MRSRNSSWTQFPYLVALTAGSTALVSPAVGQVTHENYKLSPTQSSMGDEFGVSIAIDNGIVAVGALADDGVGLFSGTAYLFDASTGAQLAKLMSTDGSVGQGFSWSIAIDDGVVVVGAIYDGTNGFDSGAAYLFDATTGLQYAKLLPSDGAADDGFGWSVGIDNGIVAVGAIRDDDNGDDSGSVYLFDAATGAQTNKLLPDDGAFGDWFGGALSIKDGVLAVGAVGDRDNGFFAGSAYLFDASTGDQITRLLAEDGEPGDQFGWSVAIDDGTVAVGAFGDDDNGSNAGAVYLFDAQTGGQFDKLTPDDGAPGDDFGTSVSMSNGVLAAGARWSDDNGIDSGSAYLFDVDTGDQAAKLLPTDGAEEDWFGNSVAIDGAFVGVGANWNDDPEYHSGGAYIFEVPGSQCLADLNNDGETDFADISIFLAAFTSQDPAADLNGDGETDFVDISTFLASFTAGCP